MSDGKNVFYTFYVVLEVQRPESRGYSLFHNEYEDWNIDFLNQN